jgi:hypothetical protein
MLSTVPVQRLLEGIAAALQTYVEPAVDDRFARMQLQAIDEILRNVATRVEWRREEVEAEIAEAERLLVGLREAGSPVDAPAPHTDLEEHRRQTLAVLGEALEWVQSRPAGEAGSAAAHEAVVAYLQREVGRERDRLKSGMYS